MKKFFKAACLLCCLTTSGIYAQVGMNNNSPNPNAALDLNNTDGTNDKGLLLPKVALTSTDSFTPMTAHVAGMKVYNTFTSAAGANQVTPGEYFNDGTKWVRVSSSSDSGNDWTLGGNTNGVLKELGTKDAQPIPFITNGTPKMNLSTDGVLALSKDVDPSLDFAITEGSGSITSKELGRLRIMADEVGMRGVNGISISQFGNQFSTYGSGLLTIRGRGSHANPQEIQGGDMIGTLAWVGYTPSSSVKLTNFGLIQSSVRVNSTGNLFGSMFLSSQSGGSIYLDTGVTLGNGVLKDATQNKTNIFFGGNIGTTYKLQPSQVNANMSDIDQTSFYLNTANSTVNFSLPKASGANKGRILVVVASGGASSRVGLIPSAGDTIALMGAASTTSTTTAAISIKVMSNGVDTWYQIP